MLLYDSMDAKRYTLISYTLISSRSVGRKFSWIRADVFVQSAVVQSTERTLFLLYSEIVAS